MHLSFIGFTNSFCFFFKVFYFMLPETTATSLSFALVDAINLKFKSLDKGTSDRVVTTEFELIEGRSSSCIFHGIERSILISLYN